MSPTQAEWEYPHSKLKAEAVIHEERGRIPTAILRTSGVNDDRRRSIPTSQPIRRIYEKKFESHLFIGDQDREQSFLHLDDPVSCICRVLQRHADRGAEGLFLIGQPDVVSYGEPENRAAI